jgi:cobalamin biosynthetic protein CobC
MGDPVVTGAFHWHGGRLDEARARFGSGSDWLDLSTGINPYPWPGAARLRFDWQALPAPSALRALEEAAAAHFGVEPALCCAVPGSEIGLRLLGRLIDLPGRFMPPCYRTHGAIFANSRPAAADPAGERAALVIANPNNPDGRILPVPILRQWLAQQEAAGGWLVVDEAFADPLPCAGMAGDVAEGRRLVVMRSFGKFFGLAGVRLGFAIAPPELIAALRGLLGDWPLSAAAIEVGTRAYRDRHWIAATRAALPRRAAALDAVLQRNGFAPMGGSPLFRLIDSGRAVALFGRLARCRILTRPFADNASWLRIGLPPDDAALERFDKALADG